MGCTASKTVSFDQMEVVNTSLAQGRGAMLEAKLSLRKRYNQQRRELDELIRQREIAFKNIEQMKAMDPKKSGNKSALEAKIAHLTRIVSNADEIIAFSEKELAAQQAVINKLPMTW